MRFAGKLIVGFMANACLFSNGASAQSLLGGAFSGVLYDIDVATGTASNPRTVGTGADSLAGIALAPDGMLYGLTTFAGTPANALIAIDASTGASTTVGLTGLPSISDGDLAFDPMSGVMYGIQSFSDNRHLFTLDVATGAGSVVGELGDLTSGDFSALAFAPDGAMYILDTGVIDDGMNIYTRLLTVDKSTAAITSSVTLSTELGFTAGMAFHPATGMLYVADGGAGQGTNSLYTLDPTTGMLTLVGPTGLPEGLAGLAFAIPEPGVGWLASAALIALATSRSAGRRRAALRMRGEKRPPQ